MARLTGNKGEWSELYAFVKLLSTGKLYAADENLNRIDDTYFPILRILRSEASNLDTAYVIRPEDGSVDVLQNDKGPKKLMRDRLEEYASNLCDGIKKGSKAAFAIDCAENIMGELACSKIAAPSTDKTDITMQLHDINTGYESICGFSIKSELGNPPTLLNASGATNFVFKISGISDAEMDRINAIATDTKIIDRITAISVTGSIEFQHAKNDTFSGNLMLIDTCMEEIIAAILLDYYRNNISDCRTLLSLLEERNPLKYPRRGMYEYKFKKFLCAVALGMTPARVWNGREEANGVYVIVKDDGDVVAYHIYNRDKFETYLLNHTKLERGSTSRHHFASIYKEDDNEKYMNLNLQIRFI